VVAFAPVVLVLPVLYNAAGIRSSITFRQGRRTIGDASDGSPWSARAVPHSELIRQHCC
jgi:hypothetical protein